MPESAIAILLAQIDRAFDHRSWHGTNLRGSIKGMKAEAAAWRPARDRHNIWEIIVHAAYWKYVVRRRLRSEARGSFPLKGSNWFRRPVDREISETAWKADIALLVETHLGLRESIEQLTSRQLRHAPGGSRVSNLELITGIAAHDFYHAGQIQLLKRIRAGT